MSERKNLRAGLLGLIMVLAIGGLTILANRNAPTPAPATPAAAQQPASVGLQSLAELNNSTPARRTLHIEDWRTSSGTRVLFVAAPELPMFDLRLTFAAGSSQDGEHPGLAVLTNAMLNEGVPGMDTDAIARAFEDLGAQFSNGAYRDMAVVSLRSLTQATQREAALALFSQVIGQPSFPNEPLQRIKNQLLSSFEQYQHNPGKLASLALMATLYGDHPYAHPSEGTAQSIPPLRREQLQAFHRRAYSAGNAVIALVGDLSRSEAEAIAEQVSAALPAGPALPAVAAPKAPEASQQHIDYPSAQTHINLAQLGIPRNHPDWPALYLGNQVFGGGGFGSRLMEEIREKRGLTYGVYSAFSPMQAAGPFSISLQTRAEMTDGTLQLIREQLQQFLNEGPTAAELQRAKRELAGSFPLSTASNADIVGQLAAMAFYDLPLDQMERFMEQVQALSREQVRKAMARHLDPQRLVVVTAGPQVAQQPLPEPGSSSESSNQPGRAH